MRLDNFWWLIYWPILFGAISSLLFMRKREEVEGEICIRWTYLGAAILVFPYIIWAGYRHGFGDTEQYRATFKAVPSTLSQIIPYMREVQKGPGFRLIELLFKCLISRSDIIFFIFIAAIQMACLVYIFRKYSTNFWMSMFLFIASTDYLSWMHNGLRQFLAVNIIFLSLPLIARGKYLYAIILVFLAVPIHSTALIFLPFIFVISGSTWNWRTLLFMAVIIVAVVYADRITGFLTEALVDTAYEGDIDILIHNDGTNIFRVLFYSVPAIMSLLFRPYLERESNPFMNICVNLSVITAGFYIFSYFTSGILMGAIPIYFSLSNYILIPWLIRVVFDRESVLILEIIFCIVYVMFFYYQCGVTWGLL